MLPVSHSRAAATLAAALTLGSPLAATAPVYLAPSFVAGSAIADDPPAPRRPSRRLGRATLGTFNYAAPLDEGSQSVLSNNDTNTITVTTWYRTEAGALTPTLTTLAPGETKVIDSIAGSRLAFYNQTGASDAKNFQVRVQSNHIVNGHEVTENVRAVTLEELLATGEHAWLPGVVDPLTATEGLLIFNGQATDGQFDLGRYNASGNLLAGKTNLVVPAFSFLSVPDAYAYFNVTPGPSTAKGYTKLYPASNGLTAFALHNHASGDHDTIRALSRAQMQNNFVFPILQRLTSGVPFAKYVDLHTINLDQEPYTQLFNVAFQARGAIGPSTFFNGRNLHALDHDVFVEAMSTFFGDLTATEYNGSGIASNAATVFTASKIRTAMPHGDVGAWVPAMNARDACGDISAVIAHPCSLVGLNHGDGYTTTIGVANLESAAATITAEVYTAAGVLAGTQQITLGQYENREVDVLSQYGNLTNARVIIKSNRHIQTWAATENADGDTDFQAGTRMPLPQLTLEQEVINFVDWNLPDESGRIYASNAEWRELINGTSLTRSYNHDISVAIYNNANPPLPFPLDLMEQGNLDDVDCNLTNGEVFRTYDPIQLSPQASGLRQYKEPDGRVIDFPLTAQGVSEVRAVLREFFIDRVMNFPAAYGFERGVPPGELPSPTWTTLDPNPNPCP